MVRKTWHWPAPQRGSSTWRAVAASVADGRHLLHGSRTPGLTVIDPRAPLDRSPDAYSKQTAVFATEDPTWAISYAVRSKDCPQFLNACFYPGAEAGTTTQRRLFYSYGRRPDGSVPVSPGTVYVLDAAGFERQPPEDDPAVGSTVTECQWTSLRPARVVAAFTVTPDDLPTPLPSHDTASVDARAHEGPAAFPWGAPDRP